MFRYLWLSALVLLIACAEVPSGETESISSPAEAPISCVSFALQVQAELSDPNMQFLCGVNLIGTGDKQGEQWLQKAAQQGHVWAQTILGMSYLDGTEFQRDYGEAKRWLLKAAEHGNPVAQVGLAKIRIEGLGVRKDLTRAYMWLILASEKHEDLPPIIASEIMNRVPQDKQQNIQSVIKGLESVIEGLEKVAEGTKNVIQVSLTPSQVAEGQRQASEWKAKQAQAQ